MHRSLLRCAAAAATAAMLAGPASAVVISFEDLNPGGGITTVGPQYAALGVTFNSVQAMDFSQRLPQVPNFAHSGTRAVEQCFAAEFCSSPIAASFTAAQSRVKVWVGLDFAPQQAFTIQLAGYNSTDALVATDSVTIPAGASPVAVRFPLSIGTVSPSIVRAEVTIPGGFMNGVVVDDVEFDTIGPPPPCLAVGPPSLTVFQPTGTVTTRTNRFEYQDQASSLDPFATRTITSVGPSGQPHVAVSQVAQQPTIHTWMYGYLEPGLNLVTVRVQDCGGATTRNFQVQYNPLPADLGFEVLGYEVTQSIQDLFHSVPLISGKRTYLRLYLGLTGSATSLTNVRATLNAFRPGNDPTFQHGPALAPFNVKSLNAVTVDNSVNLLTKRADMTKSLNFELPPDWVVDGQVNFSLGSITIDDVDFPAPNVTGGFVNAIGHLRYQEFDPAPFLRVKLVNVPYHPIGKPAEVHTPRQLDNDLLFSWLGRAYPTARVIPSVSTTATLPYAPGEIVAPTPAPFVFRFDADWINSMVQNMRSMDIAGGSVDPRTHYYGQVDDDGNAHFMRGKADSIPSWVASGPTGSNTWGWDTDGSYGDWYGGHELGHTFGRTHTEFCGAEACPEWISDFCPGGFQAYPYPEGLISGGPRGEEGLGVGFDIGDSSHNIKPAAYSPGIFHDIMTYCDSEWMSDFSYERILGRLRYEAQNSPSPQRLKADAVPDGVLLTGVLNLTQKSGTLLPAWRMGGLAPSELPATSRFHILFKSAGGTTLADYPFLPNVDTEPVEGEDLTANLAETLPWVANTRRISVVWDGAEIAHLTVSPNAPTVHVVSPNGGETLSGTVNVQWSASDADGDALTYTLQYSRDGGDTWQTLSTNVTSNPAPVDLSGLPGTTSAKFRVIASDGVNTGMDDSDAVFTVAGKAPVVHIISPTDASAFDSNQTVVFTGQGNDVEDGMLSGTKLVWTSSVQGALGTGDAISTQLKPGTHTITLTGTDSDGQSSSTSITVTVSAAAPVASPGPGRAVVVGQLVNFNAAAGSLGYPPLSYHWDLLQKPLSANATLNGVDSATPSFTPDVVGVYTLQLTVQDGTGLSAVALVTITATTAGNALRIAGGLEAATAGDMPLLNIELGAPSTSVIDILDAVRLMRSSAPAGAGFGTVTVSAGNAYAGGVLIDDARLNGRPDVPIVVGHIQVKSNAPALAVQYVTAQGKWAIVPDSAGTIQTGERLGYVFGPQVRSITRSASNTPFSWGVRLDDPALQQNPDAIVLTTHNLNAVPGNSPLGVWYSNGGWLAYNEEGDAMANGERYFYTDAGASGGSVVHTRSNGSGNGVILDDPRLNGNPKAVVLVQHAVQNQYNTSPMGARYNATAAKWVAYNEDGSGLAFFEAVNYLVATQ
jgi:hypothetical protein